MDARTRQSGEAVVESAGRRGRPAGRGRAAGRGWAIGLAAVVVMSAAPATSFGAKIQDLVRVKGAEESRLMGMGLVVGLAGTGDGGDFQPAMRPLAEALRKLVDSQVLVEELDDADNVALVSVEMTVPAAGVREGDKLDVTVSAVGAAESLAGGRLLMTPLIGPDPRRSAVYAYASGGLVLEDPATPTVARVSQGGQMVRNVFSRVFDEQGRITLVLEHNVASWPMANYLANLINSFMAPDGPPVARAIDQKNVLVRVGPTQRNDPAPFLSQILTLHVDPDQIASQARVIINERSGTIVISGEVTLSPVVISHRGLTITTAPEPADEPAPDGQPAAGEAPQPPEQERFVGLHARGDLRESQQTSLRRLLEALNQLKVPVEDRIAIIKEVHRIGKLNAELIVQ